MPFIDAQKENKVSRRLLRRFPDITISAQDNRWCRDAVIFIASDATYLARHAQVAVRSASLNSPGLLFHLHVINPTDDSFEEISRLKADCPNIGLNYSYEYKHFRLWIGRKRTLRKYARTYYACIRFVRIMQLLKIYALPIVNMDADSLLNKDIGPLLQAIRREYDVALFLRNSETDDRCKIAAGLCIFYPTRAGLRFIEHACIRIMRGLLKWEPWFLDQIALYGAYARHKDFARVFEIDATTFCFGPFAESALIWSAKGKPNHTDKVFLEKVDRIKRCTFT
jgi:hypothetical protein